MTGRIDKFGAFIMAVLLHVVLLSAMVIAFDYRAPVAFTPMAIQATLVQEIPDMAAPPVEKLPEVKPEPIVEEVDEAPPPDPKPEPDNSEELRRQAEQEKRRMDALIETQRLEKKRVEEERLEKEELEKLKQQEKAEREQKERDEAQSKKDEEQRQEREREDAERKREDDIKRQREENERLRREQETVQRDQEIDEEARRLAAESSPAMAAYQFAIAQKIRRSWSVPASAGADTVCVVNVRQLRGGDIVGVNILSCNGDDAVKRSVEAAIRRASPLPKPSNPDLFRSDLELNLRPEQ